MEHSITDWKREGKKILEPLIKLFVWLNLSPNVFTFLGLILSFIAAYFYYKYKFWAGGVVLLVMGFFDIVDGEVARRKGKETKFGALFDSTSDRIAEYIIFAVFLWIFRSKLWWFIVVMLSLIGSQLVSYLRARGEGLGVSERSGIFDRTGRFLYLIFLSFICSVIGYRYFVYFLVPYMVGTWGTVVQRFLKLKQKFKKEGGKYHG